MSKLVAERNTELWRRRLYLPAYDISEAARYSGTSPQTITYWHYEPSRYGVLLPKAKHKPLSYLQLVEVAFVATFRALGVSLQRIRKAREYASKTFNVEYPFAEQRWLTEGFHALLDLRDIEGEAEYNKLIFADKAGQEAWQTMVSDRFAEFDYEHGLALVWHVAGRYSPIIIDPRIAFGAPTVDGIATWIIRGRVEARESISEIKDDFGLTEEQIKFALEFEGIPIAA